MNLVSNGDLENGSACLFVGLIGCAEQYPITH